MEYSALTSPVPDALGQQRPPTFLEAADQVRHLAHGGRVLGRHCREASGIHRCIGAVEQLDETSHEIVYVDQGQRRRCVANLDRQAAGDVVAEGSHRRVVVRAAPFPEDIGKAEHIYRKAMTLGYCEHGVLCTTLALSVEVVLAGLNGGRQQNRNLFTRDSCDAGGRFAKRTSEISIDRGEVGWILWAIDPGQVEHEVHVFELFSYLRNVI